MMNVTGEHTPAETSVTSFLGNLPELLAAMMNDPRIMVAIADFEDYRYVQFWAEDDFIVAEVISNINVYNGDALTHEQEQLLEVAGWSVPDPDAGHPNWRRQEWGPGAILSIAEAAADASTRILRQGMDPGLQKVMLKTFPVDKHSVKRKVDLEGPEQAQAEIDEQFAEIIRGFYDTDLDGEA